MKKICYVTTLSISICAFFIEQLNFLSENGFSVTVICSPDDNLKGKLGKNIKFIPVNIPRGIHPLGMIKAILNLQKIFSKEKFDFVQYSTPNAAFCSSIASRLAKIGVRNYHLMGLRYLGEKGAKRKLLFYMEKLACSQSTAIECVSKSNLDLSIKSGLFPKEKGAVVFNGSSGGLNLQKYNKNFRTEYRTNIRKKYNIPLDAFVFGFVGRITRDKGVNEILGAFKTFENTYLMMIGNEEDIAGIDSELYKWSKETSKIIYTGQVEDIEKYYCALDVLLFPSYREGFGNVVIEAAAMGTPAIISRIPGPIDAVIENKTALVVDVKNETQLKDAMKKIMQNELFISMSDEASDFVRSRFDSKLLNAKILERKNFLLKGN